MFGMVKCFLCSVLCVLWHLERNAVVRCRMMPLFVLFMFPLFFIYIYIFIFIYIYSFFLLYSCLLVFLFDYFLIFFLFDIFYFFISIFDIFLIIFCVFWIFLFLIFLFFICPLDFLLYLSLSYLVRFVLCSCLCSLTSLFFAHVLCVCRVEVYAFCY